MRVGYSISIAEMKMKLRPAGTNIFTVPTNLFLREVAVWEWSPIAPRVTSSLNVTAAIESGTIKRRSGRTCSFHGVREYSLPKRGEANLKSELARQDQHHCLFNLVVFRFEGSQFEELHNRRSSDHSLGKAIFGCLYRSHNLPASRWQTKLLPVEQN